MSTLTIQPSDDDNYFQEGSPSSNYGTSAVLQVRSWNSFDARVLLRFDFSALPADAIITSATLSLYLGSGASYSGRTHECYRLTQAAWTETGSNRNDYDTGLSWATPGGDYTATDMASVVLPGSLGWVNWDVLDLVSWFRDNASEVADFLIKDSAENDSTQRAANYHSNNYTTDTALRPKLDIVYTLPINDVVFNLPSLSVSAFSSPGVADLTLPQLSIQGGSGATGVISFPSLSAQGLGAAGASFSLPIVTVNAVGHPNIDVLIGLPIFTLQAVPPPSVVTLPIFTLSAFGAAVAELTLPSLSLVALASGDDDVSVALPSITVSAEQKNHGNGVITLPQLSPSFTAKQGTVESVAMTLPGLSLSIRAGLTTDLSLPGLNIAGIGFSGSVARLNKSLPRMTINVKATQHEVGSFDVSLPAFTLDANLFTGEISLTSTRNLPSLAINARGFRGENGDVGITLPALELTTSNFSSLNGTVTQALGMLTLDAFADVYINRII